MDNASQDNELVKAIPISVFTLFHEATVNS